MGQARSKALEEADDAKDDVTELINLLDNKRREYIEVVKSTRGSGTDANREVQGGRTVCRVSEIRVQIEGKKDPGIDVAISDFIEVAQGGDKAKSAAVKGAQKLLSTGLDALFGVSGGSGMEKRGFVILFLNFAFVRIDYLVYSYSVSGTKWGATAFQSGSCYVADIAVLDTSTDLKPSEIDFLIGQALYVPAPKGDPTDSVTDREYFLIMKIKIQLVVSAVLSRMLGKEKITLDEVQETISKLIETQQLINEEFAKLTNFVEEDFIEEAPDDRFTTEATQRRYMKR